MRFAKRSGMRSSSSRAICSKNSCSTTSRYHEALPREICAICYTTATRMSLFSFTSGLILGALGNSLLVGAAIIVATIIFEDPTTVFVGVLSADGLIPIPLALASLYLGIIFGDSFL